MNQGLENLFSPKKTGLLADCARAFLAAFGTPALMGEKLGVIFIGEMPGNRFDSLLSACGFENDSKGFFLSIRDQIIDAAARGESALVSFDDLELPHMFLYHLLEADDPGQSLLTVKNTQKLETAVGFPVQEPDTLQQVLDHYPVRLSRHVIRQCLVSGAVAAQYLPFAGELDPEGHTLTFDGHFKQGLMEQMYQNRAIFLLDMRCPVYCRFCFRKHKSLRREKSPTAKGVEQAVARVRQNKAIREILITGGEPLINPRNLDAALGGLVEIDHVQTMRIATRSLAYYPHLFLHHDRELISRLQDWQAVCRKKGKQIEIGVHMVHPDEVSVQTLEIISRLTASGIPVYVQTPFLKGLNDTGEVLGRLFTLLRLAGAEIYYIFTPCHPIHGTQKYWSPISLSMNAYARLRADFSDRAVPKLCTATPLGKMEWHTSGWAVEPDETDRDHIWIRTPYTREYFKDMVQDDAALPEVRENRDGTLNVKCLIDMGDPGLFMGGHELPVVSSSPIKTGRELKAIQALFYDSSALMETQEKAPCPGVGRVHKTRVEIDLPRPEAVMVYLAEHPGITDIVLRLAGADGGIDREISQLSKFIRDLDRFGNRPFCIRIRWRAFQARPGAFRPGHVDKIVNLADFSFDRLRRVEIETWWLSPDQVIPAHKSLGQSLSAKGIPVYGNLPLLTGINDDPVLVAQMAHALREAGVDFHHVYVSGLSVQNQFKGPQVTTDRVLSIASHVRKVCSGRQIPLYVAWTHKGEVDFGLAGDFSFLA